MKRFLPLIPWLALLAFPLLEVSAHAVTRARVPPAADWQAAAALVRSQWKASDLVTVAPAWADPLLRRVLGDRIDLAMAGRSDTAGYERLWVVSIRGAQSPEVPARGAPLLDRHFGKVRVALWELGANRVRYDFVREFARARVRLDGPRGSEDCQLRKQRPQRGGALGAGVLAPAERFMCQGARGPWVAPVVMEDLDLAPRYCLYQPPAGSERLRVTFPDVPLGDTLVLYAGLYYEHERMRQGKPIELRVAIDGRRVAKLTHRDGDGWKPLRIPTRGGSGEVSFEVRGKESRGRHFCWAGSTRDEGQR